MRQLNVATAVIQSEKCTHASNAERTRLLQMIIESCADSDVILFPAGYYYWAKRTLGNVFSLEKAVTGAIRKARSSAIVCLGVDYRDYTDETANVSGNIDQIAYAIGTNGIIAAGRKFYPTSVEVGNIVKAADFMSKEFGKARIFQVKGFTCYLAVCYDGFGIRHLNIKNPDVDIVLDLVHSFFRRGRGASGDVDFARKGFAGASMQWQCPVFGSAVFFEREVPRNWPTGVMWSGADSVKSFKYADNQMHRTDKIEVTGSKESSVVYKYIVEE